jgi:hypothetical protein
MANPLTLLMPLIPGTNPLDVAKALEGFQPQLQAALTSIGTVHYARFLVMDTSVPNLQPGPAGKGPYVLAVITEYDGSFQAYIGDFVAQVGTIFDALLQFVVGGAAVTPVADHTTAFGAFIAANDLSQQPGSQGLYEAYPLTVQQVLAG